MKVKRSVAQTTLSCVLSSLVWRLLCGTVLFWVFVQSPSVIIWLRLIDWLIDLKAPNIACSNYTPLRLSFRPHSHGCPVRSLTIWCILHTKSVEWTYQFLSVWLGLCLQLQRQHPLLESSQISFQIRNEKILKCLKKKLCMYILVSLRSKMEVISADLIKFSL